MPQSKKSTSPLNPASKRSQSRQSSTPKKQKRQATVYDAVAGRVSSTGFIPLKPRVSKHRDTPSSSTVPNPPEEVLFRRAGAPIRFEEADIYWADRDLTEEQKLPGSDLLKAIHAYASDFYGRATAHHGVVDFESLDETALLGLGILLEEMAGEVLGETGDLAFVEEPEVGEGEERDAASEHGDEPVTGRKEKQGTSSLAESQTPASGSATESGEKRNRKRRKTKPVHHDDKER